MPKERSTSTSTGWAEIPMVVAEQIFACMAFLTEIYYKKHVTHGMFDISLIFFIEKLNNKNTGFYNKKGPSKFERPFVYQLKNRLCRR
jgi:hypothetical protein